MNTPGVYANVDELQQRWQPLTEQEQQKAYTLLADASDFMRAQAGNSLDTVNSETLKRVCCAIVKRVMISDRVQGATGHTESVGGVSESFTFASPGTGSTGGMWLTREEKKALGMVQSIWSVDLSEPA